MRPARVAALALPALALALAAPRAPAEEGKGEGPRRLVVEGVGRLPAFAHASVTGRLVFLSGMLGTEEGGTELVEGGIGPETTRALENVERVLEAVGASRRHVARCTVFLATMEDYAAMNEAWSAFFGSPPPARATVAAAGLAVGASVEIACVAERPERSGEE